MKQGSRDLHKLIKKLFVDTFFMNVLISKLAT
jgi:hypothetical protein